MTKKQKKGLSCTRQQGWLRALICDFRWDSSVTIEHPMIRTAIDTLCEERSDGLPLSNSRLETLGLLVIGIASVRTVNLSHISGEMPTQAKVESTDRRLQCFFQHVRFGQDWSARPVVRMLELSGSWNPCLDRTNWRIGRKEINLLVLAVATRRYRVPLIWTVLGKAGNSNTKECISLMKRYSAPSTTPIVVYKD